MHPGEESCIVAVLLWAVQLGGVRKMRMIDLLLVGIIMVFIAIYAAALAVQKKR